jgi:hypothetical protein
MKRLNKLGTLVVTNNVATLLVVMVGAMGLGTLGATESGSVGNAQNALNIMAQPNWTIGMQGLIRNAQGALAGNDKVLLTILLHGDSASQSEPIWEEEHLVQLQEGLYSIRLGTSKSLQEVLPCDCWVQVQKDGLPIGARFPLLKAPMAYTANLVTGAIGEQVEQPEHWVTARQQVDSVLMARVLAVESEQSQYATKALLDSSVLLIDTRIAESAQSGEVADSVLMARVLAVESEQSQYATMAALDSGNLVIDSRLTTMEQFSDLADSALEYRVALVEDAFISKQVADSLYINQEEGDLRYVLASVEKTPQFTVLNSSEFNYLPTQYVDQGALGVTVKCDEMAFLLKNSFAQAPIQLPRGATLDSVVAYVYWNQDVQNQVALRVVRKNWDQDYEVLVAGNAMGTAQYPTGVLQELNATKKLFSHRIVLSGGYAVADASEYLVLEWEVKKALTGKCKEFGMIAMALQHVKIYYH